MSSKRNFIETDFVQHEKNDQLDYSGPDYILGLLNKYDRKSHVEGQQNRQVAY